MKKIKIISLKKQKRYTAGSPEIKSFNTIESRICLERELWFFRHLCEDEWLEELRESLNISKKRADTALMRRIITGSIRKRMK